MGYCRKHERSRIIKRRLLLLLCYCSFDRSSDTPAAGTALVSPMNVRFELWARSLFGVIICTAWGAYTFLLSYLSRHECALRWEEEKRNNSKVGTDYAWSVMYDETAVWPENIMICPIPLFSFVVLNVCFRFFIG